MNHIKESNLLHLVSEKSKKILNWNPIWDFEKTIYRTAFWYDNVQKNRYNELKNYVWMI